MFHEKVVLKISQNLHKNTWVVVSFLIKSQISSLQLKNPKGLFSSEFLEKF